MKKFIGVTIALMATFGIAEAQNIALPSPEMKGGLPVNQALAERHSTREFDKTKEIPLQIVSNLLWATCGINRPESGLRTNPTARNQQEVDAYWFVSKGVYRYDYKANQLVEVVKGDYRHLVAGGEKFKQEFVMEAPASVVLVGDLAKMAERAALIDCGIACENLNIFCAGNGLATVPRMTMDVEGIQKLLGLPETSVPMMNNPVGYAK